MKLETFYAEIYRRISNSKPTKIESGVATAIVETIDAMTSGALFRGVEKISEDWEWPK